ncbi:hypothetical protein SAY86_002739 [Trapa natans]|uniref:Uncharacterized protein n=1 Tax=Trapa natans TaxID=22666 RepID=A0AAN7R2R7_TRANT|nr:hypothetical protein SAY86_002739 [Trapa natans]
MTLMASRRKLFLIGNHPGDLFGAGSGFLSGLLCRIMLRAVQSFWLLLCEVLLWPFGSVNRYISSRTYREGVDGSERNERSYHLYDLQAENREASASLEETL